MFKKKFPGIWRSNPPLPWPFTLKSASRAFPLAVLIVAGACQSLPPLPRVNLEEAGWTVRQGQAVWHPRPDAPEIAGDIIVATNPDGRAFVQFSKSPLSLAVAQKTRASWEIEFPMQHRRYAGRGRPPARLLWLQLPDALTHKTLAKPWSWQLLPDDHWQLENPKTGESLEGYFAP